MQQLIIQGFSWQCKYYYEVIKENYLTSTPAFLAICQHVFNYFFSKIVNDLKLGVLLSDTFPINKK